jgi:hypothetical protein
MQAYLAVLDATTLEDLMAPQASALGFGALPSVAAPRNGAARRATPEGD